MRLAPAPWCPNGTAHDREVSHARLALCSYAGLAVASVWGSPKLPNPSREDGAAIFGCRTLIAGKRGDIIVALVPNAHTFAPDWPEGVLNPQAPTACLTVGRCALHHPRAVTEMQPLSCGRWDCANNLLGVIIASAA